MRSLRPALSLVCLVLICGVGVQRADAAKYRFEGTATLCSGTCDSFASLAIGTVISGEWGIEPDTNGDWSLADFVDVDSDVDMDGNPDGIFGALVLAPDQVPPIPLVPWNPGPPNNATTANPLPLTPGIAPIRATGRDLVTGGTTNADGELENGIILHEFAVPPFSSNSAWVIFEIDLNGDGLTTARVCLFYATAGCIPGATESVNIIGTFARVVEPAELSVDPTSADFGEVQINEAATPIPLTVDNMGTGDLVITSVDTTELPSGFTVDESDCTAGAVAPDSSCTITVGFESSVADMFMGSFAIVSNDAESPEQVNVSATAIAGTITVDPDPLAFDQILTGAVVELNVEVSNTGDGALTITGVGVDETLEDPFSLSDGCTGQVLAPGGEPCVIMVQFEPMEAASFDDIFDIKSDDPDTPSFSVEVSGSAADAEAPIILVPGITNVMPQAAVDFGMLLAGEMTEQPLTVRNAGNGPLTIDSIELGGAAADDYTQTNNCSTLAPSAACTVNIVFAPMVGGDRNATLTIVSDAVNEPDLVIDLTGTAFAGARIELADTDLVFGSTGQPVDIGASESATLTVSSTGTEDLVVSGTLIAGPDETEFAVSAETCSAAAVAPGATCTITVEFSPLSVSDKTATLSVESNDTVSRAVDVGLTGFVFEGPRVDLPVTEIAVGTDEDPVEIGQSSEQSFMVMSTGTDDLAVTDIAISDDQLMQFSFTDDCIAAPVPAGGNCTITVTFTPQAAGEQTATMTISTNDVTVAFTRAPLAVIALVGVGVAPPPPPPPPVPGSAVTTPPAFATGDKGSDGACFIATAAFGSYLDPNVQVLRDFRDEVLMRTGAGRDFVAFYYSNSPMLADYIARHESVRTATRWLLTPLIYALTYPAPAIALLFATLLALRRRRLVHAT